MADDKARAQATVDKNREACALPSALSASIHGGSSPPLVLRACLLASSSSRCSCRGREPRSPAVRGVSTPSCSRREGEVPEREVRAGRQGRRRRAGRVAEPRRDAGLRRGGHCGADHWQRLASECGIDRAAADAGAGAHRRGRRPHGFPHLPIRNAGLMDELTELPALS